MDGGMVVVGKVEQFLPHFYNLKQWEQGDEPIFEVLAPWWSAQVEDWWNWRLGSDGTAARPSNS